MNNNITDIELDLIDCSIANNHYLVKDIVEFIKINIAINPSIGGVLDGLTTGGDEYIEFSELLIDDKYPENSYQKILEHMDISDDPLFIIPTEYPCVIHAYILFDENTCEYISSCKVLSQVEALKLISDKLNKLTAMNDVLSTLVLRSHGFDPGPLVK
jgi:hypothetical protein